MEKVVRLIGKEFLSTYIAELREEDGNSILHFLVNKEIKGN